MRTSGSEQVPLQGRGADGDLRFHRRLVQSRAATFGLWISITHRLRKGGPQTAGTVSRKTAHEIRVTPQLLFLLTRSPNPTPAKLVFQKLKHRMRSTDGRTCETLWRSVGRIHNQFTPEQCVNQFLNAGYNSPRIGRSERDCSSGRGAGSPGQRIALEEFKPSVLALAAQRDLVNRERRRQIGQVSLNG